MKTVGIICEYNPFHLGHRIQLQDVRSRMGDDACIIALMSGSFVERGGPAILSKEDRAAIALSEGVNLVLELPFPWSMSGADRFAAGALSILEGLGGVDYLAFGSECGEIDRLRQIANVLKSDLFEKKISELSDEHPELSYALLREAAYLATTGRELPQLPPNDLLGVAYLTHIQKIQPLALTRMPGYSAGGARSAYRCGNIEQLSESVPLSTAAALEKKDTFSDVAIDRAVLAHLRMITKQQLATFAECSPELAAELKKAVRTSSTTEEIVKKATSKHYTSARVRRALWHSYLQTPKSAPLSIPHFTNLLAADQLGRTFLRSVSKQSSIAVITRPSNAEISSKIASEYALSSVVDEVYASLHGQNIIKKPPIIK
jgi:predicted nucleotidyltransferase